MAIFANTTSARLQLYADVAALLNFPYTLGNGQAVKGNSVSSLQDHLRDRWRGVSNYNNFVDTCEELQFKVGRGRNDRGTPALVVYLPVSEATCTAAG